MKKTYEKPEVTKVDFKFEDAIAASGCTLMPVFENNPMTASMCKTL